KQIYAIGNATDAGRTVFTGYRTGESLTFKEDTEADYRGITDEQYENRMLLQHVMVRNGFVPIDCEWWHFTLKNEPYPDTYFEFPVSSQYLRR
ncbi:MAG: hypothetical protein J6W36_03410, partial [Clostridiales bacterium]|nr:hypothetical protein [Clostridiales bacterium]